MTTTTKELLDAEQEAILGQMDTLLAQRRAAEKTAREIREKQNELVIEAERLGVPKLVLSRRAGLTRQTIYGVLLRHEAGR